MRLLRFVLLGSLLTYAWRSASSESPAPACPPLVRDRVAAPVAALVPDRVAVPVAAAALTPGPQSCPWVEPKRDQAFVRMLAAEQFNCDEIHEYSFSAHELCGRSFLDQYVLWVCDRYVTYDWTEGDGWSVSDTQPPAAGGSCPSSVPAALRPRRELHLEAPRSAPGRLLERGV